MLLIKLIKLIKNKSILPAIIFIISISISINAQAQSAGKFQFSSNLISGNNFSRSLPTYANSHINYTVGAVSYGYTGFNQSFNPDNSVNSYFPAYYSADNFKKGEKSDISVGKITLEILSGYIAGVIFTGLSVPIADGLFSSKCAPFSRADKIACGMMFYGYGVGSAFGVYFIGSDGEFNKKSALATLLGGIIPMGIAVIAANKQNLGELPFKLALVLPPISTTIAFNIFNR